MEYIVIEVPDMNDSISRIVLNKKQYLLQFTYNHTGDYWMFSVLTALKEPIIRGIKIVPSFPINLLYASNEEMPKGVFGAMTELDRIGRDDFKNGKAKFVFIPLAE